VFADQLDKWVDVAAHINCGGWDLRYDGVSTLGGGLSVGLIGSRHGSPKVKTTRRDGRHGVGDNAPCARIW
jgi:hypothetical protein